MPIKPMTDQEFCEHHLRSAICPNLERWPTDTTHWAALVRAGGEMRAIVSKGLKEIAAVDADKLLSAEGKRTRKADIGARALDQLTEPGSVAKAREAVEAQMRRWAAKVSTHIKPAEDHVTAVLHAQCREKIASLKENRLTFLKKHASDPVIASALLEAPAFLSGLSDGELAMVRDVVERAFLSAEIVEAKGKVADALLETERSLRAGQAMIRQHARVEKPTAAELAMARSRQVA